MGGILPGSSHRTWQAPRSLAPWIADVSYSLDAGEPPSVRVLPDGGVDLLFAAATSGGPWTADVFGAKRRALQVHDLLPMRKLAVRLRPGAAACWLGVAAHTLVDRALALDAVLGDAGRTLAERLADAPDDGERLARLLGSLARHARDRAPAPALVAAAVEHTRATGGRLAVRTLAGHLGVGERRLERLFREHVGLGPKRFARIVRLETARRALAGGASQLEAALAAGYHDQPHLHREARALAGVAASAL